MRPGITGLWQIEAGTRPTSTDGRLDLIYIDRWSIWLDLKILARTVPALLTQGGH